jgi:hypothetical protein
MDRRDQRRLAVLGLLAAGLLVDACGLSAGSTNAPIRVTVTRDFGARPVAAVNVARGGSSETMAQLLARSLRAQLNPDGSVRSIEGDAAGEGRAWFSFINGIGTSITPLELKLTEVQPGDSVWWDLHDASQSTTARAVVGAYPEPFEHGIGGRKLPTTIECAQNVSSACKQVSSTLTGDGVKLATQLLGTGSGQDSLGVVVGTWNELAPQLVGSIVDHGPSTSGIYARFTDAGGSLQLLDGRGRVVRTLGAGAGLVAATRDIQSQPTWLITGTDPAGVGAAARALTAGALRRRFAVAVDRGAAVALPVRPAG